MKKFIIIIAITLQLSQAFDIFGGFGFGNKTTKALNLFIPKRAEFSVPRCLRNVADIIEEVESFQLKNSFELTIEKIIRNIEHYSEMLFSCGFGFQYQVFFNLFNTFASQQGSCGSDKSHSCGQNANANMNENINPEDHRGNFYKIIKPCAMKIRDQFYLFQEKFSNPNTSKLDEIKILFESIRIAEECSLGAFSVIFHSSAPCVESFQLFVTQLHDLQQSSNIYLGLLYSGTGIINAFNHMVFTCKDPLINIANPFD